VGTARRQGAKKIYQFEILPKPSENRPSDTPWPQWPRIMRTSSSHEEGCERRWSVCTKKFSARPSGIVAEELSASQVEWLKKSDGWKIKELPDTEFSIRFDLAILALGFVHVTYKGLIRDLDFKLNERGNIRVNNYRTSRSWVFAAGDSISGASLVVKAIKSGRQAALAIDTIY